MFHLSFIAFREEYFVGFLKIQRYAAIALVGLVFININAFIKKENCLINIILILLSVSVGYSSWMNKDLSGYGLINIIFSVVKTVAPLIALEYACDIIVSYGVVGACLILLLMVVSLLKRKEDYSRSYMALMYTFIIVSMVEITLGNYFLITLALLAFVENGNRSN